MSDFTDLVPPLELCQKIPAGEFENSALAWIKLPNLNPEAKIKMHAFCVGVYSEIEKIEAPAPTLQEILADLAVNNKTVTMTYFWYDDKWTVTGQIGPFKGEGVAAGERGNTAEAALRAWLVRKGII